MNFEEAWKICDNIPGWFSKKDAEIYWRLCNECQGKVVEIGSFLGKSSVLASFSKQIICIDPWIAGPNMLKCIREKTPDHLHHLSFKELFDYYTFNFKENIEVIQDYDFNLYANWKKGPIDLIHLDHLHTESAVSNSLNGWKKHASKKCKILVHDSNIKGVMDAVINNNDIIIEEIINKSEYKPIICRYRNFLI